jgi:hypothetical protein
MPEDSLAGEKEKVPGYVKRKIRERKTSKEKPLVTRAHASQARISTKKEETLHDLLAPYLPAAVQAWVDGLKATKVAWNQATHCFEDTGLPDSKVRADCARAIVEYVIGKPIERSLEVSGSYKELSVILEELRQSPEAMRLLPPELFESIAGGGSSSKSGPENSEIIPTNSSLSTTEGKEPEPASEARLTPEDSEQKTG